jgi:hypothetical protein
MKIRKIFFILLIVLLGAGVLTGAYFLFSQGRPVPVPVKEKVMNGVTYMRRVQYLPHSMVAHVLVIDRRDRKPAFLVTPPDDDIEGEGVIRARTTSQFLEEFGVQIAINGDGFFPWWSRTPADYYPHVGDPVTPNGFTASKGDRYANGLQDISPEPTLYISRGGELVFNRMPNNVYHALSGDRMLLQGGEIVEGLDDSKADPRTAIGVSRNGRYTYLVVVDGRQPFYSEGATFYELAKFLKDLGAFNAMSLDGGGSSTMVIRGERGKAVVLNSPIDNYIPLRERPVANHLGVTFK